MIKNKFYLMTMLLILFSAATMAQSGSWSDANYQNPSWGKDYNTKNNLDVNNEKDFAKFASMVNNGRDFKNKTVTLKAHLKNIHSGEPSRATAFPSVVSICRKGTTSMPVCSDTSWAAAWKTYCW